MHPCFKQSLLKSTKLKQFFSFILLFFFLTTLVPSGIIELPVKAEEAINSSISATKKKPIEIIEKRTEYSKTYDNGDGTFTSEISQSPMHYLENGKFLDIDSNITADAEGNFKNKSNKFKAKFSNKGKSTELTTFELEGKKIVYSLSDAPSFGEKYYTQINNVIPSFEENKIIYKDIYDKVDLRQTIVTDGLKEDFILKEYTGKNAFTFSLKMSGVKAVKENDGSISFFNSERPSERLFYIPRPAMMDSNIDPNSGDGTKSDAVRYELNQQGANIYVSVIADDAWLKSPDRKYPVYIDPSTTLSPTGDAFVTDAYPSNNYNSSWNSTELYYQLKSGYYDATTGTNYSYIKFDLSSLSGKYITAATLSLYCAHSYYPTTATGVWIDTVNSAWDASTINWINKPTSTPIMDPINTAQPLVVNVYEGNTANFNVIKPVSNWVSTTYSGVTKSKPTANFGFKIHENGNGQTYWKKFKASGNDTGDPTLTVTYTDPPAPTAVTVVNNDNSNTGYIKLSWPAVPNAAGYEVAILNGKQYEFFDVGNVTSWDTKDKGIWPTYKEITTLDPVTQKGRYALHHDGKGTELALDPRSVYQNAGTTYANNRNYDIRITAYNSYGETTVSAPAISTFPAAQDMLLGDQDFYAMHENKVNYGISKVNAASGNLYLSFEDLTIPGRGLDLSLKRSFNSLDNTAGILGTGWTFIYEMNLFERHDGSMVFTDQDGSRIVFSKNGTSYTSPKGVFYTLIKLGDGTYTITDREKNVYSFNSQGKLTEIKDYNGNTLKVIYDASGRIDYVIDDFGRKLDFSFNLPIITITDPAQRRLEYILDSTGRLNKVRLWYKDGSVFHIKNNEGVVNDSQNESVITYTGDTSINISNPRARNIKYDFVNGKVTSYTKYLTVYGFSGIDYLFVDTAKSNPVTSFSYDTANKRTTVTEANTFIKEYVYNDDGTLKDRNVQYDKAKPLINNHFEYNVQKQVIKEVDGNGAGTYYVYDNQHRLINKLLPQAKDVDGVSQPVLVTAFTYSDTKNPYKSTVKEEKQLTSTSYTSNILPNLTPNPTTGNYDTVSTMLGNSSYYVTDQEASRKTKFSYDQYGNLIEERVVVDISDSTKDFITIYTYGVGGRLETKEIIQDASGLEGSKVKTSYVYVDNSPYLDKVTDAEGRVTDYTFEFTTGNKRFETDTYGNTSEFTYYPFGLLTTQKDTYKVPQENGTETTKTQTVSYKYDLVGMKTSYTDANGKTTTYVYDEDNNLIVTHTPNLTVKSYGDYGTEEIIESTDKHISIYTLYDNVGNFVLERNGRAYRSTKEYDGAGRLIKERDPKGNKVFYELDGNGNRISERRVSPGDYTLSIKSLKYDELNRLLGETAEEDAASYNYIKKYYYDAFGNLLITKNIADSSIVNTVTNTYDIFNRVKTIKDSADPNIQTSYEYDYVGNKLLEKVGTNQITTSFEYDKLDRLVKVIDGNSKVTKYIFDNSSNKKTTIKPADEQGNSDQIIELYDGLERLTVKKSINSASATPTVENFEYDAAGNLVIETTKDDKGSTQKKESEYDEIGRKLKETSTVDGDTSKSIVRKYKYDFNNNVVTAWYNDLGNSSLNSKTDTVYDEIDRELTSKTKEVGGQNHIKNTTAYDDNNKILNITSELVDANDVPLTVNPFKMTSSIKKDDNDRTEYVKNGSLDVSYKYYDNDLPKTITQTNVFEESFIYDNDKLKTQTLKRLSDNSLLSARSYNYHDSGKVESIKDGEDAKNSLTIASYLYTAAGQLQNAEIKDNNGNNKIYKYHYDNKGNVKTVDIDNVPGVIDFVYDNEDKLKEKNFIENGTTKKISFTYENGNLKTVTDENGNVTTYNFNADNELISIEAPNKTVTYSYNSQGNRALKKVGNKTFTYYYDGDSLVRETIEDSSDSSNNREIVYLRNSEGNALGFKIGANYYYYHFNNRGDVEAIVDSTGNIVVEYSYEVWGKVSVLKDTSADKVADINPYTYVGKYGVFFDSDTNLYYMGFRDYDPSTYRFISPDTEDGDEEVPFSQNKYLYAEGDPINNIDPDGHWILDAIFLAADIVEFAKNPTLAGLGWVALDIVSFADVTGAASTTLHSIKEVKVLEKGYETVRIYNKSKKTAKITKNTKRFIEASKEVASSLKGGRFAEIDAIKEIDEVGHHMAQNAYNKTIGISRADGPALLMSKEDHALTRTFAGKGRTTMIKDSGLTARQRLAKDVIDVRKQFGRKYNKGMLQMLDYAKTLPQYRK